MNIKHISQHILWDKYYSINNKQKWQDISKYEELSEDFIREFKDKINWIYISRNQTLSLRFIEEFQDRVDWHEIVIYQRLSEELVTKFFDKIETEDILNNYVIPSFLKRKLVKIQKRIILKK